MTIKVGINGFGRMGRLALRIAFDQADLEITQINDPGGNTETMAHLLRFDSVHGKWQKPVSFSDQAVIVDGNEIAHSSNLNIGDTDWSQCDLVIEASGKMKSSEVLAAYLEQGVKRVVVSGPVKEQGVLNVVMGVNHQLYDPAQHRIVTAASCTTNCIAPVISVIHKALGIHRGSFTTIHGPTNTQIILDAPHKDLRRARACGMSLIPTTTGSATAVVHIFPDLKGKLNGHAVRVPVANASLTDCVFDLERDTTVEQANALLKNAADNELKGILGYEELPLVSIDYRTDPRSSVIDALSTMVIDKRQLKLFAWYDNEWGYANRLVELVSMVGQADQAS